MICLEHVYKGKNVKYTNLTNFLTLDYIKSRKALFYISMKNPLFTKDLISWFLSYCEEMNWDAEICVVDQPYYSYIDWENRLLDKCNSNERLKLDKIAKEVKKRLNKVIQKNNFQRNFTVIEWCSLASQCPKWIKSEIVEAFNSNQKVYNILSMQSHNIFKEKTANIDMSGKYQFLLSEIPVLIWSYYKDKESVVDIYPGENAPFFTKLEKGEYEEELPLISKLFRNSSPLIYGNVSTI